MPVLLEDRLIITPCLSMKKCIMKFNENAYVVGTRPAYKNGDISEWRDTNIGDCKVFNKFNAAMLEFNED